MKKKLTKKILVALLIVFIGMQFITIDKLNKPVDDSIDFIALTHPPKEVESILRNTCYDCHSEQTSYPWYTNVAPVSWWIADHIEHGKEHLNFSEWGNYPNGKQAHKLEECAEEVEEGEMPLNSYTWMHGGSKLAENEREEMEEWFNGLRTSLLN